MKKTTINNLEDLIATAETKVLDVLGCQKDNIIVITDLADFDNYIQDCINTGFIAIDTETNNSLDPITCKLMGLCLYSPGLKQAYIPVNHRDPITKIKLTNQISESDIKFELQKIIDSKIKVIMHNGKFDYQVLKCTTGIKIVPYWDTMIAAKLINENEQAGLKWQYTHHIDTKQQEYKLDQLFKDLEYADIKPDIFALYAATDSLMTYKLYEYQMPYLKSEKIERLFFDIEMPMVEIAAEMELTGALVDLEYCKKLSDKYSKKLCDIDEQIKEVLSNLSNVITSWRNSAKADEPEIVFPKQKTINKMSKVRFEKVYPFIDPVSGKRYKHGKLKKLLLEDPIKLTSPKQLQILFYDVFDMGRVKSIRPYGTGKNETELLIEKCDDYLTLINNKLNDKFKDNEGNIIIFPEGEKCFLREDQHKYKNIKKLCELILKRREVDKLITTYLNVTPILGKHWNDGKIRFHLNTLGARTGRFSSGGKWKFIENGIPVKISGLNAQNIPSKNHEIRLLFKASKGNVFVGGDFSQQEAKVTAFLSQDPKMLGVYSEGKDIYACIAQSIYKNKYEDNLEFNENGELSLEGKARRSVGKIVILATMYGMGPASVARKLNVDRQSAQAMLDNFFNDFSEVRNAIDTSIKLCKYNGYVTDIYGRKRRLPNIKLPLYRVQFYREPDNLRSANDILISYFNKANSSEITKRELKLLAKAAKNDGLEIISNELYIQKAERQCFNARIQGSSATLTKKTMILIYNDPIIKKCNARLVFQIHDELILECPEEYSEIVKQRLNEIMTLSVGTLGITVGMKCDTVIESRWGEDPMSSEILESKLKLEKQGSKNVFEDLCEEYSNFPKDSIKKFLAGETSVIKF